MAHLRRIMIYPIKSLDGVSIDEAEVLAGGALANDRRFVIMADGGHYVIGKKVAAVHRIRAEYDLSAMKVRFNSADEFSLIDQRSEIAAWLRKTLDIPCVLAENAFGGFPDDMDACGPTLVGTATLAEVCTWFPDLKIDEARRRFRANFEVDDADAFWEDRLIGPSGTEVPFTIGSVRWLGVNPCRRCVVPTRDSTTGEALSGFQRTFAQRRRESLPTWAPADRFDHFYRLAVNTRLAPDPQSLRLRVGDAVSIG